MDVEYIDELFAAFGTVRVRRMFGGAGIFADGLMLGLVSDGIIYLKADDKTVAAFEREGMRPFEYTVKGNQRALTSYWRMPDRLYDDGDELAVWAREALASARRLEIASKSKSRAQRRKTR
jgi:DNA transformation protein